jgi:ankyrin repeat protein
MVRDKGFPFVAVMAIVVAFVSSCAPVDVNLALLKASETGSLQQVKSLLAKGASVNTKDDFDRTPLMLSAFGGHADIAAALLKAGADIGAKAKYGQTALQFAVERGNTAVADLLRAAGAGS